MESKYALRIATVRLIDESKDIILCSESLPLEEQARDNEIIEVLKDSAQTTIIRLAGKRKLKSLKTVVNIIEVKDLTKLNRDNMHIALSFENMEESCSFVSTDYCNDTLPRRYLCYGTVYDNRWYRRQLSDYNAEQKFYQIGDIVTVYGDNGFKYVVLTNCENCIGKVTYSNLYDIVRIDGAKFMIEDDAVHYNELIKVGHDIKLAQKFVQHKSGYYTDEYIAKVLAMKE